jgi:hypothetical protein
MALTHHQLRDDERAIMILQFARTLHPDAGTEALKVLCRSLERRCEAAAGRAKH